MLQLFFDPHTKPATQKQMSIEERQMWIAQQTLDLEIAKFHWQQITMVVGALVVLGFIRLK